MISKDNDNIVNNAWTPSYYGYDDGGNVRQLTDSTGKVTDSYEYDAFGNEFTVSGTTRNEVLYRGEQYDSDLSLYYLRARYYNPATGRFMSRDPNEPGPVDATGTPTDIGELHKYLYAGGDPANAVDPTGRDLVGYGLIVGGSELGIEDYVVSRAGAAVALCFYGLARTIYVIAHDQSFWNDLDGGAAIAGCALMFPLPPVT